MSLPRPGAGPEQRRHARYPLNVAGTAWALHHAIPPFAVKASDISLSGMMLHASAQAVTALHPGDELLLAFRDAVSGDEFGLRVVLRWKRAGLMLVLGTWAFGVEFASTAEADVRRLLDPAAKAAGPLSPR